MSSVEDTVYARVFAQRAMEQAGGRSFRFNLFELGGALADLGTLLPLAVGLITLNGMNTTSVFLGAGVCYIMVGLFYRLPVPVQPLKAVAAIAIARGLAPNIISASGLLMAAVLLLLAITGVTGFVPRLFPKPIIRGIQLGVALLLLKAGVEMIAKKQVVVGGHASVMHLASFAVPMGLVLALALAVVLILFLRDDRFPASLAVLGVGVVASFFWGTFQGLHALRLGISLPGLSIPTLKDLGTAMVILVIPQIPLTLGNAVYATQDTARTYFGAKAKRVTPKALAATMGVSNLMAGLIGGMPVCHGSAGLTAHYRMGARTGACAIMIGFMLVALALFMDGNALPVLSLIPYAVLGVLVIFVGVQHGLLVRDLRSARDISVATLVAIIGFITGNLAIGFGVGIALVAVSSRIQGLVTNHVHERA